MLTTHILIHFFGLDKIHTDPTKSCGSHIILVGIDKLFVGLS